MWVLPTFMLFLGVQSGWTAQECDKDKGPSGSIECLKVTGYQSQYQLGTCLAKAYIRDRGHDYVCDRTRNYCWYQCMLDIHGKPSGFVTEDCSCDPYGTSPTSSLRQECYSPSGVNCYWYRTCLEKKYPCKPSGNAYVIRFAERFCRVFEEEKVKFSSDAQRWLDAAGKCLQVTATLPLLRLPADPTCNQIREKALDSYTKCYLNPDYGGPSICDLNCWQHIKIFWTIRGSFTKLDTAWETLKGLWNIGTKCPSHKIQEIDECFRRSSLGVIKFLKLNTENLMRRKRRSSEPTSNVDVLSRFADDVGSAIARSLKWNPDVMDWFAYTANWVSLGNLDIVIVLADKKALGIVTAPIASIDFDQTIQDFVSAVEKGTLRLQVDGYNVWVKSLSLCYDKSCDKTRKLAVSKKPPRNGGTGSSHGTIGLCGVIIAFILLMDKLFF
ncbi:uncharacterized protein LOC144642657 [Oculina patagonica]